MASDTTNPTPKPQVIAPAQVAPTTPKPQVASTTPKPQAAPIALKVASAPMAAKTSPAVAPAPVVSTPVVSPQPATGPKFELPGAVYSPQLLESVIYDIQYYLDWYRQNQIRKKVGAKPKEEPNHSDETVLVIKTWLGAKPATVEAMEELLVYLKKMKLPQVHIMLAALPNMNQREMLVNWFRTNVGNGLLLSFVADRNLGGGVVIRTPNRVFDYTWKQQLIAGRSKLAEILKRV
jgi:hypothetical protein